jgi:hypothetical protein
MKLRGLLGMFAMVLVVTSTAQGAGLLQVDGFDDNSFDQAFGPAGVSSSSTAGSMLGGNREVIATATAGLPFQRLQAESNLGNASFFSHSQDSTITGNTLLIYDGGGGIGLNPTGLGGIDVTNAGAIDQIGIRVSLDDLPVDLVLTAYTDAGNVSEFTLSLPGGIFSDQDFFINFASFTPTAGAGADFTNLGALTLFVDGVNQSTDLIFDFIANGQAVPEPVSVAGWLVCMLTAGVFVYRRKGLVRG